MTISRGQMERQLRMGGGIMDIVPREPAIFGGIKKAVKKTVKGVTKTVKKIASSDVGKAAIAAAALYYMPKYGIKDAGGLPAFLQGAKAKLGDFFVGSPLVEGVGRDTFATSGLGKILGTKAGSGALKLATLGAVSTYLTKTLGMSPQQAEQELARDPTGYLERYYRNLNPNASQEEVMQFVTSNTQEYAVGGRVGFADGPVLPPDPTQPVNPFGPKPGDFGIEEDIPIKMASNLENEKILEALFEKYLDMGLSPKDAAEAAREEFDRMSKMKTEGRGLAALGGKMDTASDNAMQAASVEGLPIRQNPKGVKELDLRNTGGFIPPVGIKEKEDDIPAMLSNNEFVMTADAVRGMGGGNINLGAQRMYDQMKMLEAGGKV